MGKKTVKPVPDQSPKEASLEDILYRTYIRQKDVPVALTIKWMASAPVFSKLLSPPETFPFRNVLRNRCRSGLRLAPRNVASG